METSKIAEINAHCLLLSYNLGKALRVGDTENFLQEYDKCLESLEDQNKLEDIKELARNISDMTDSEYHIIEQGFHEGHISISSLAQHKLGKNLHEVLNYISSKLYSDSGICSDGDHDSERTLQTPLSMICLPQNTATNLTAKDVSNEFSQSNNDNQISSTEVTTTTITTDIYQSSHSINGLYMYSNGDIIKVNEKKEERPIKRSLDQFTNSSSSYDKRPPSRTSNHQSCVDYLWKNWCAVQKEISRR